jgi:hypothetical protein
MPAKANTRQNRNPGTYPPQPETKRYLDLFTYVSSVRESTWRNQALHGSEKEQYLGEEMMDLCGKRDAEQKNDHGDGNGPDILALFGGKNLLRDMFHFGLLLLVDSIGFGHGVALGIVGMTPVCRKDGKFYRARRAIQVGTGAICPL